MENPYLFFFVDASFRFGLLKMTTNSTVTSSPEVVQELNKGFGAAWQRHYEVNDGAGGVYRRAPHFHKGPKRTKEGDVAVLVGILFSEVELIQCAFVPLGPVESCQE